MRRFMSFSGVGYNQVPEDILVSQLFPMLNTQDLHSVAGVCTEWHKSANKDRLWLAFAINEFGAQAVVAKRRASKRPGKEVYCLLKLETSERSRQQQYQQLNQLFDRMHLQRRALSYSDINFSIDYTDTH